MPKFRYQCPCGLQFDVFAKAGPEKKSTFCPSCNQESKRMLPNVITGVFIKTVTGPVPQNTGIASLDADPDRIIGQAAKQGWQVIEQRMQDKIQILKNNPDITGKDLSRNLDGSYRVLSEEERGAHDRAFAINQLANARSKKRG